MSATLSHPSIAAAATVRPLRFGAECGAGEPGGRGVQWLLKRNCSATPRQMIACYLALSGVSIAIGAFFWAQGATLVMPFASLEIIAVGLALLVYTRHVGDTERISLQPGRLTVERTFGGHVERAEFAPAWVRIEPEHGDRSLIELSGQGQRIAVGRFVRPELRRQLAEELRWTLRRWPWLPARAPFDEPESQDKSGN
ncbi:MAG TPA: DUF2244 domain-containing protein [Burkholderiaceae bacterium]